MEERREEDRRAKFSNPLIVSPAVHAYTMQWGFQEDSVATELRTKTAEHAQAIMMGDPVEAAFFGLLLPAIGAKKVVEVGVFTGYTTLLMAQALPHDGKVVALDVSEEYTSIGKPFWEKAGVSHKIDLRIQSAVDSMEQMVKSNEEVETYDFVFVDADKINYERYYELSLQLIRPNGIIAIDNVLWGGKVTDISLQDESTVALRDISRRVYEDDRVQHVLLPFADGIVLARKK